jgi:two-component system, LytTR family, sensor kinase
VERVISFCIRVWRFSVPAGVFLALFAALRDYAASRTPGETPLAFLPLFGSETAICLLWALLAPAVIYIISTFPLERKTWLKNGAIHLAGFAMLAVVYTVVLWFVDRIAWAGQIGGFSQFLSQSWPVTIPNGLIKYYAPTLLGGYIAVFCTRLRDQELRAARLSSQLAQAQVRALKMQLQPHFIFNTLHSISTLVHTDADGADRMIAQMSDLLRFTLDSEASEFIPLREEIYYITKYLAIEQTRFSDRLTLEFDIDPATESYPVPALILQPIVENSIRHGISRMTGGGQITIKTWMGNRHIHVRVSDTGRWSEPDPANSSGRAGGLGLKNTRERLEQVYGGDFEIAIRHGPGGAGTSVEISLPILANELQVFQSAGHFAIAGQI